MYCLCTRCIIVNSVQLRSEFGKFAYTAICMRKCTLWSDNTCVFTRFHSVKNANTDFIWSSGMLPGKMFWYFTIIKTFFQIQNLLYKGHVLKKSMKIFIVFSFSIFSIPLKILEINQILFLILFLDYWSNIQICIWLYVNKWKNIL